MRERAAVEGRRSAGRRGDARLLLVAGFGLCASTSAATIVGVVLPVGGPGALLVSTALAAVLGTAVLALVTLHRIGRRATEERRVAGLREAALEAELRRLRTLAAAQQALERSGTETDAWDVAVRATELVDGGVELLLASPSSSVLFRVAVTSPGRSPSHCEVGRSERCPAIRASRALVFETSESIYACPQLRHRRGGPCAAVCLPVQVLGRSVGVLHVTTRTEARPDSDDVEALGRLVAQLGTRVGILRAMERSELQASTDPLTGQLNRRTLDVLGRQLDEREVPYAVAVIDLDRFKVLNDTFGHDVGDAALRHFAAVLRREVRAGDVVCRYGGEEFVVVFPGCSTVEAAPVLHRSRRALSEESSRDDVPPFTASFGLADSTHGIDFEHVLRYADRALLRAKQEGRDRVVIADPADHPGRPTERAVPQARGTRQAVTPEVSPARPGGGAPRG
ncbi:MAG: sensor domain-containing diguanylate cyclase [Acidimicrobiia bacterium]|nr:sensor domain-containing diguanylate cyclase [Acidimicrobiia bacterium]